jgi:septum formation protein
MPGTQPLSEGSLPSPGSEPSVPAQPQPSSETLQQPQSSRPLRLILASASPARLATLRAAGLNPTVRVSAVDEPALLASTGVTDAEKIPLLLARAKAEDVAASLASASAGSSGSAGSSATDSNDGSDDEPTIVLGCDSILDLDGEALGKPDDPADAIRRWQRMRGRSGQLRTGHWLIDRRFPQAGLAQGAVGATSVTTVHFADLSDDEIKAYVATGEPLNVAGAFTIDGLGGAFVSRIEGDHHGVVGVSLPLLRELLGTFDVPWTDLWAPASS